MNNKLKQEVYDLLKSNGGYHGGPFPLSWNVALYDTDTDWESVLPKALTCEEFSFACFCKSTMRRAIKQVAASYNPESMWESTQEYLWRSLNEDNTYNTCSPEVLKKWKLDDQYFDVKLELHGRCGKHLVISEFEGIKLYPMRNSELIHNSFFLTILKDNEDLYGGAFSNQWVRRLAAYVEECNKMFTSKKASEEFNFQVVYNIASRIYEAANEIETKRKETRKRTKKAIFDSVEQFV